MKERAEKRIKKAADAAQIIHHTNPRLKNK
jgi:hypothetical protein